MAVTIDINGLLAALRLSDSPEEVKEATRLLSYCREAVTKHVAIAPDATHNEAVRRLAGYLYDMPEAGRGDAYANSMRNSGAARILLPYRVHRAGYSDAVAEAQAAVGRVGNPVIDVAISGGSLVVTFADGSIETHTLPAGGGGGGSTVDQTARDAASTAQGDIDTHEGTPHNTDTTARGAATTAQTTATTAQGTANTAQSEITAHETNHPSGVPDGSSQRRRLKWNPNTGAWVAVSDVETIYYGAAGAGDYLHVSAALAAGLNTAGTRVATTSYMLYKGFGANVLRNDHLAAQWAGLGSAPVVFCLAPHHTDYINDFSLTVRTRAACLDLDHQLCLYQQHRIRH